MVLFEIYQRFKGHFLNELRVSFKEHVWATASEFNSDKKDIMMINPIRAGSFVTSQNLCVRDGRMFFTVLLNGYDTRTNIVWQKINNFV